MIFARIWKKNIVTVLLKNLVIGNERNCQKYLNKNKIKTINLDTILILMERNLPENGKKYNNIKQTDVAV